MAAYAALNSVMYILQQIQHHPRPPITIQNQYMDSLCEIISFLQDFLENYSHLHIEDEDKEVLESRIADAAYAAEDIIESHIVDQILANYKENNCIDLFCRGVKKVIQILAPILNLCSPNHKTDQILSGDQERSSNSLFCQDLQKVIEDLNSIKKEAMGIEEKIVRTKGDELPRSIISVSANIIGSSTVPPPKSKNNNIMVGFDDVLIQIMDRLTGHPPSRQVLPIVGMGGIGKTTLARNVYDHQYIMNQFDVRIWVTISQEYRLRDILLQALSCHQDVENKTSEDELGHKLYKSLCGKRYLIILDDIWCIEAWEKLMSFFPNNKNGSRIMITTRLLNVSNHFGSCAFKMNFLDEDKSWDLFCKIVFPQDQCCPTELEEIGKKIAKNCKGLPLSIAVIGGLLAKSGKTQHWEYIAENLNPIVNLENDMHCLKILYLSYNHLPMHLKPCFLYMGVFPEDAAISVSWLKKLWVAEGFLKPMEAKSLEVVAEQYLKGLIDRNLILVHKLGSSGKVKYCKIHDLLRDLCLREGEKDKFLWVSEVPDLDSLEGIQSQRRISVHKGASHKEYHIDRVLKAVPSASFARSLICDFKDIRMLSHCFRLMRVFNMGGKYTNMDEEKKYGSSLKDIFKLVNSRYLDFETKWKSTSIFPSSTHLLWNLQILIINGGRINDNIHIPLEIWEMSQLMHLEIGNLSLLDPPNVPLIHEGDDDDFVLRYLHTLKRVGNLKLSEEVIKRIPNIKNLQVVYFDFDEGCWHNYCFVNLGLLNKLESLYIDCSFGSEQSWLIELVKNLTFPHSLKKLTLHGTHLFWEDMSMIGSLPHLQVLKLKRESFLGSNWNPVEGQFLCLKFLQIQSCNDLVYWNANRTHFPCLEQLVLRFLRNLKEIPLDIGQISTFRAIELWECNNSAVMSANNLLDEQVELGNEDLQVHVMCRKNIELESLTTHNFQFETYYWENEEFFHYQNTSARRSSPIFGTMPRRLAPRFISLRLLASR